jgi:Raf kinase inhibitor-like YbhB/YbcL family protein
MKPMREPVITRDDAMRAMQGNWKRLSKLVFGMALCVMAGRGALAVDAGASGGAAASNTPDSSGGSFMLTSPDLPVGATVPAIHVLNDNGCTGGNQSPALNWHDAPAGTAGYAISIYDPDAPGRGFWHWSVFGIPASTHSLPVNASASGAVAALGALQARNDFGGDGYGGPCPPPGRPHRYVISVHALRNLRTSLQNGRPAAVFAHEIDALEIAKASLTVVYGR